MSEWKVKLLEKKKKITAAENQNLPAEMRETVFLKFWQKLSNRKKLLQKKKNTYIDC